MSKKSGLDKINEILEKLDNIDKKINVLDQNIKKIANSVKIPELLEKISNTSLANYVNNASDLNELKEKYSNITNNSIPTAVPKVQAVNPQDILKKKTKQDSKVFVKGKVSVKIGDTFVPVGLADVVIYDDKDKIIKETRTNMAGDYSSMLVPGKYVAEIKGKYKDKELVPQNIPFIVKETDKEVIIK